LPSKGLRGGRGPSNGAWQIPFFQGPRLKALFNAPSPQLAPNRGGFQFSGELHPSHGPGGETRARWPLLEGTGRTGHPRERAGGPAPEKRPASGAALGPTAQRLMEEPGVSFRSLPRKAALEGALFLSKNFFPSLGACPTNVRPWAGGRINRSAVGGPPGAPFQPSPLLFSLAPPAERIWAVGKNDLKDGGTKLEKAQNSWDPRKQTKPP